MIYENNKATISGTVIGALTYDHETLGEKFYIAKVKVERLSASHDVIPVMISERLIDAQENYDGKYISVLGQFRSYNQHDVVKSRLILSLFAKKVEIYEQDDNEDLNDIYLDGYICKEPVFRETPLGSEIADVLLAVNRQYGKTDYIPCIFWGRNAHYVSKMGIGTQCQVNGRIQSREYLKKVSENQAEQRIAYEVSIGRMTIKND